MTLAEAALVPVHTDEFDAAVDAAALACEAAPTDKAAAQVLMLLLQRNDDFCLSAVYGR